MKKQNLEKLDEEIKKRYNVKEKRKKVKMKVSGGKVKELQRIIIKKR